jgi:phosphoribosylaminoimidazolecarboxamide formyltransferase/IMP cyclohydrolase
MTARRALLSVYRKEGIVDLARGLAGRGFEILSTGGTAAELEQAGIAVSAVSEITGFPEILDGRVKTLHPKIHAGILACRELPQHMSALAQHGIAPIELVVVNLYPFEEKVAKGCSFEEAVENVDIGGPTLVRAAAKNFRSVAVVVDPADYALLLEQLDRPEGIDAATRLYFAQKAFRHTGRYDAAIAGYFAQVEERDGTYAPAENDETFPYRLGLTFEKVQDLRYGENPHQKAAFYAEQNVDTRQDTGITWAKQLWGKELSFNNILDADATWSAAVDFAEPTVAIVKHTNTCGLASHPDIAEAYRRAFAGDTVSAFGGIVASNRKVNLEMAEAMRDVFYEIVIAPEYDDDALELLEKKKNLRILLAELPPDYAATPIGYLDYRRVKGGLLVQTSDSLAENDIHLKTITQRKPTKAELDDLLFAWRAVKHIKSNAILLVKDKAIVGMGAGQPNRVVSVDIATKKAGDKSKGSVMASDAMFPFPDSVEQAAAAGVTAIIQPGGSIRDEDSIKAADKHDIAMVLTGVRHFLH